VRCRDSEIDDVPDWSDDHQRSCMRVSRHLAAPNRTTNSIGRKLLEPPDIVVVAGASPVTGKAGAVDPDELVGGGELHRRDPARRVSRCGKDLSLDP